MKIIKQIKTNLINSAIVYIVFGLIMITFPEFINDFFSTIVGLVVLIFGASQLASYASFGSYTASAKYTLLLGLCLSIFGIYILFNPKFISSIIPTISGIIIIVDAINKIKQTIELKKVKYNKWWINLIASIVLLVLGIILIKNPFNAVSLMIRILGIIILVDGIYDLSTINLYSKKLKKVVKTFK